MISTHSPVETSDDPSIHLLLVSLVPLPPHTPVPSRRYEGKCLLLFTKERTKLESSASDVIRL